MPKLCQHTAIVDDMSGFGHLGRHIDGVPYYADRALLQPADLVVIMHDGEDVKSHVDYLRRVRIGPQRVLSVSNPNLLDGLDEDPQAMGELEAYLRKSHERVLQFFCVTERTEAFIERHSIDPKRVDSAPRTISDRMNDKGQLRQIAKQCGRGIEQALLPYEVTCEPKTVMATVKSYLARPASDIEYVVLKRTNLAGGDGFQRVTRDLSEAEVEARVVEYLRQQSWNTLTLTAHTDVGRAGGQPESLELALETIDRSDLRDVSRGMQQGIERIRALVAGQFEKNADVSYVKISRQNIFGGASLKIRRGLPSSEALKRYLLDHCRNEILIEEGCDGDDFSTQIVVENGDFRKLGPTKQIVDEHGRHLGNIMTRDFDDSLAAKGLTYEDMRTMLSISRDLAEFAHTRIEGYRGAIGFDFRKRRRDGKICLLECNGRKTAASYPLAILAQLEGRLREPFNATKQERVNCGVVMHNAVPTTARSWGALKEKLGDLLFDGTFGALPFNIRLMRLDRPAVGIVAVGKTLDRSMEISELARARLSA